MGLPELTRNAVHVLPEGGLERKLALGRPLRVKLGIDVTAPDVTLGNGIPLQRMRAFQDEGHTGVLIVGDYTTRIGDPSGRKTERPMIDPSVIDRNAQRYFEHASTIIDAERTELRFNSEWLGKLDFAEVLRLTRTTTVARMLERDDFSKRFAASEPISVSELLYPLMQAYDSVAVEADVELGGTDQLYNLLMGRDVMEAYGLEPQVALTVEYLDSWDGTGMSASRGNYIGLKEPPEEQFGKTMRIPDSLLQQWYRLVMERDDLPADPFQAKLELARFIVRRAWGEEAVDRRGGPLHARGPRGPGAGGGAGDRARRGGRPPPGALGGDVRPVDEPLAPSDRPGRGEGRRPLDHVLRRRHGLRGRGRHPGRKAPISAYPRCLTPPRPLLSFSGRSGRRVGMSL